MLEQKKADLEQKRLLQQGRHTWFKKFLCTVCVIKGLLSCESPWFDSNNMPMYIAGRNKTGGLQETEESNTTDVLPTGEGVLIIDVVKVNI